MQIVLWSNGSDGVGTTTLSSVLATMIAGKLNYKTFITHSMTGDLSMEDYLLKPSERQLANVNFESNIDGLFRLINNGKLTADRFKDYCFSLLSHSNLDFLNSSQIYEATDRFIQNYMYLLYLAEQFYDVIVVDLNVSMEHPLFMKVLKEADVFIVVGRQSGYHLDSLIQKVNSQKDVIKSFQLKNLLVVNQYNFSSKLSLKKLISSLKVKNPLLVSYQVDLIDACNKHELVDFVLRQLHNQRPCSFNNYLKEVNALMDEVMKSYMEVKNYV